MTDCARMRHLGARGECSNVSLFNGNTDVKKGNETPEVTQLISGQMDGNRRPLTAPGALCSGHSLTRGAPATPTDSRTATPPVSSKTEEEGFPFFAVTLFAFPAALV